MRDTLAHLLNNRDLTAEQAHHAIATILRGEANESQVGTFLALSQAKGVTLDELVGGARAMRQFLTPVSIPESIDPQTVIDTCGTGGAPKTFNISTASAIIVASCVNLPVRLRVAKHGGRSRSGRGSAEVLADLGVNIDAPPEVQSKCLEEAGVCFSFAVNHHPAMRFAAGPRKSLGFPTIFNLLGPLTNPASAPRQLLGVYDAGNAQLVAGALARLGATRAMVVHGRDGLDEITTTTRTTIFHLRDGEVTRETIDPKDLGIEYATLDQLRVGTLAEASALLASILRAEPSPALDIALLNASAALVVGEAVGSMREGLDAARHALESGEGGRTLERMRAVSGA